MRNVLLTQTTDYDCGPTTLTNALRFLFERAEIPPVLLKQIWAMGNDSYSDAGEPGKAGTSKEALRYLAHWFSEFGEKCHFPLRARFLELDDALVSPGSEIWRCLEAGGCVMLRCVINGGNGHYVLLTGFEGEGEIALFDPYDEQPEREDAACKFVHDEPKRANRIVRVDRLNREDDAEYAMGRREKREALLFERTDCQANSKETAER